MPIFTLLRRIASNLLYIFMWLAVSVPARRTWALDKIEKWTDHQKYGWVRADVALWSQALFAKYTGGSMCEYCLWAIKPGDMHEWCDLQLRVRLMDPKNLLSIAELLSGKPLHGMYSPSVTLAEYAETIFAEMSTRNLYLLDDYQTDDLPGSSPY